MARAAALLAPLLIIAQASTRVVASHYSTIGVSTHASDEEIKKAYRALALRWHPDRVDASERAKASERFKRISEAYSTLSDPVKRRQYDTFGDAPSGVQGSPFGGGYSGNGGFAPGYHQPNPFGFAGGPFQFQTSTQQPPPNAVRTFYCSLDELHAGCKRRLFLRDTWWRRLRDAQEAGWKGPGAQIAAHLGAVAASVLWRYPALVFSKRWWLRAPMFAAFWLFMLCAQLPPSPKGIFEFDVRPGWKAGTKVVFTQPERKVAFELRERRHPLFERMKNDLVYRISISRRAARRGTTVSVPTLRGDGLDVKISPNELTTASAEVVRVLEGHGMPIKGGPKRGDLRVIIRIRQLPLQLWPVSWKW